jgi:FkbM family methyltransferase
MLAANHVDHVLDIGANRGQFAEELFENGYTGRVTSFEPLPRAHARLVMKAEGRDRWTIAEALALSDEAGEANFFEASSDVSSSLLRFTANSHDGIETVDSYAVKTARLDDLEMTGRIFLKIDTQGSEMAVIRGGQNALARAVGVQVEMSLRPLYEGQALAPEVNAVMESSGFRLWDMIPAYRDNKSQQLLQYDGVFFRAE